MVKPSFFEVKSNKQPPNNLPDTRVLVNDCYTFFRTGHYESLLQVASAGLGAIAYSHVSSELSKEKVTFNVFLTVGYMNHELDFLKAIDCFSNSLNDNAKVAVSLFIDLVGADFPKKFFTFIFEKCFYHENCADGMLNLLGIMDPNSPFYYGDLIHYEPILLRLTCFWYELFKRKAELAFAFSDIGRFDETVKHIEPVHVTKAITKWSEFGMKEFYNFDSKGALVSLMIVEELFGLLDYNMKSKTHVTLHVAACCYQLYGLDQSEKHLKKKPFDPKVVPELMNKWLEKGSRFIQYKKVNKAVFFYKAALALASHKDVLRARQIHYEMALFLFRNGKFKDILKHIQAGYDVYSKPDKVTCEIWKDLAKDLFKLNRLEIANGIYKLSLSVATKRETTTKRDILSNISLINLKLKKYQEAKDSAQECLKLDSNWSKGHYRLGMAQQKLGQYPNSIKSFVNSLVMADPSEAYVHVVEILKSRVFNNSTDKLPPSVLFKDASDALRTIKKEDEKLYWDCLANILSAQIFPTKTVSIRNAIKHSGKDENFLIQLIENGANVNEDDGNVLKFAFSENRYKTCAYMIAYGARIFRNLKQPIIVCVEFVKNYGKLEVLKELLKVNHKIDISAQEDDGNSALHICCKGKSSPLKIDMIKLLIKAKIDQTLRNKENRRAIYYPGKNDARLELLNKNLKDEKVPLPPHLMEMKKAGIVAFNQRDWKEAAGILLEVFQKITSKVKYEDEQIEIMIYASISLMELNDMNHGLSLLMRADNINKKTAKTILTRLYKDNFWYVLASFAIKCVEEDEKLSFGRELTDLARRYTASANHPELVILNVVLTRLQECNEDVETLLEDSDFIAENDEKRINHPNFLKELSGKVLKLGYVQLELPCYDAFDTIIQLFEVIKCPANAKENYAVALAHSALELYSMNAAPFHWFEFKKQAIEQCYYITKVLEEHYLRLGVGMKTMSKYGEAISLFSIYIKLCEIFDVNGETCRIVLTHLAYCYAKSNQAFESVAFENISKAYDTYKEQCLDISKEWFECASTFKDLEKTLRVNNWALKVAPERENIFRAELKANISLLLMKMKNYEAAVKSARSCINLNKSWPKGYFRLGTALFKTEEYTESMKILNEGLKLVKEDTHQYSFVLEILKAKTKAGCTEMVDCDISSSAFNRVLTLLVKENKPHSWLSIQYLLLYFKTTTDIELDSIPLKTAFEHSTDERFIEILLNKVDFQDQPCLPLIEISLEKNWFLICSILIIGRPRFLHKKDPSLLMATKLTIKTGKLELIKKIIYDIDSKNSPTDNSRQLMPAILYSCEGPSNKIKLLVIQHILSLCKKLNFDIDLIAISKKITDQDSRWLLIQNKDEVDHSKQEEEKEEKITKVDPISIDDISSPIKPGKKKNKKKKKNKSPRDNSPREEAEEKNNNIIPTDEKNHEINVMEKNNETISVTPIRDVSKDIGELIQSIELDKLKTTPILSGANEDSKNETADCSVKNVENYPNGDDDEDDDEDESDEVYSDEDDSREEIIDENNKEIEEQVSFDGLPWEVECTQDVWHVLKNEKLNPIIKRKIVRKIKMLASGHWRRELAKPLEGVKKEIRLFEAKINKGSRILWEVAISFSARCSMDAVQLALLNVEDVEKGAVYVDKIRVWNIALHHDDVPKMIENIENSHVRGQSCFIRKHLKGIKQEEPLQIKKEKLPNIYINEQYTKEFLEKFASKKMSETENNEKFMFFPPASPNEQEYHILKFYAFTSAMASRILSLAHSHYDFPFQVSELEHAVIHLEPDNKCSILLLGRSGTGKTTCCLYRLWAHYQNYWSAAIHAGPHLPKLQFPIVQLNDDEEENNERIQSTPVVPDDNVRKHTERKRQPSSVSVSDLQGFIPCLCNGPCNCEMLPMNDDDRDGHISMDYCEDTSTSSDDDDNDDAEEKDLSIEDIEEYEDLRQLLVTKNEVLCNEIKKNFNELRHGGSNACANDDSIDLKNIRELEPSMYPLFITTKDLLLLLDASLDGEPFFERNAQGEMIQNIPGWGKNKTTLSFLPLFDEEVDETGEIFDENDEEIIEQENEVKSKESTRKKTEITYDVFVAEIWPRLTKMNKNEEVHPSLVWMEIKSFIKGCAESFLNETGFLTKDEYVKIGRKRAPNFTGNRSDIYMLFEKYSRVKATLGYFDEMDVHFHIYKRLKTAIVPDWGFHQIYVDETQDFTQAELLLLMKCSLNPNGLFFTGDTAQSIMNGVAFRFCDLRSLFVIARQEFEKSRMISPVVVPKKIHQLTHNYRSHSGILKLASVIVQYIKILFPESFDHLKPDVGLFSGPKPVILDTNDFSELAILLQGSKRETSTIEFGAHQVVLVQNEESKNKLPEELRHGLVLSVYEAKGLEFDDVLIYNFFKDSQAIDEWRVITSHIEDLCDEAISESSLTVLTVTDDHLECESRPLDFDKNKHKLLNAELKKLYTAVTRARVNVWIFDEDKKKRSPMFEMLQKRNLVNVVRLGQSETDAGSLFAEKSSADDWEKQGLKFYGKGLWKLAMKCAEIADSKDLQQRCLAQIQCAHALEKADEWKLKKTKRGLDEVHREFRKAAHMFLQCFLLEEAEICLKNCKEWKNVALLYEKQEKFALAGSYYRKSCDADDDALRCYELVGDFRSAIALLKARKRYLECLNLLEHVDDSKSNYLTNVTKKSITTSACEYFYKIKNYPSLEQAIEYCGYEDKVEFLFGKQDCQSLLLNVYRENGKQNEVVQYFVERKQFAEAAKECQDVVLKTTYLLLAAKQFVTGKDLTNQSKELVTQLEMVVKELDDSKSLLKAHCLYMMMYLRNDLMYWSETFDIYNRTNNNIGKLICFLHQFTVQQSDLQGKLRKSYHIKSMVDIVRIIISLIDDLLKTALSTDSIFNSLTFFGFSRTKRISLVYDTDQITLTFFQLHFSDVFSKISDTVSSTEARNCVAYLLHGMLKKFTPLFRTNLWELLKSSIVCPMLNCGEERKCSKYHGIPTLDIFEEKRGILLSMLKLHGVLADGKKKFKNSSSTSILGDFNWMDENNSKRIVDVTYEFVESYIPFLHIIKSAVLLGFFPEEKIAAYNLGSCIRFTWDQHPIMDIDTYFKLSLLAFLTDRKQPVTDELLYTSCNSSKVSWKYPFNILQNFNNSLVNLYFNYNIEAYLKSAYFMLKLPMDHVDLANPNLSTFCDLIEIPILTMICSLNAVYESIIQLPGFLKEKLYFYDRLFSRDNDSGFNNALSNLQKSQTSTLVRNFFSYIRLMISTDGNCNILLALKLQLERLNVRSDKEERLGVERLLILYALIMLHANREMAISIRDSLSKNHVNGTDPLCKLYSSISMLRNKVEAKQLLTTILKRRHDKLQTYGWSSKHGRYQIILLDDSTAEIPENTGDVKTNLKEIHETTEVNQQATESNQRFQSAWEDMAVKTDVDNTEVMLENDEQTNLELQQVKNQREANIIKNIAATKIKQWWKGIYQIILQKRNVMLFKNTVAAKRIQRWFRLMINMKHRNLASKEVKLPPDVLQDFDGNFCNACSETVVDIEKHVLLDKHVFKTKIEKTVTVLQQKLDLIYDNDASTPAERSRFAQEISFLFVQCNTVNTTKRWSTVKDVQAKCHDLLQQLNQVLNETHNVDTYEHDFALMPSKLGKGRKTR